MFCALFVLSSVAGADPHDFASLSWNGSVVGVLDGDTVDVLHKRHAERIRLYGIDCPEKSQAFGKVAKHATSPLMFGRPVTVKLLAQLEVTPGWTIGETKYVRHLIQAKHDLFGEVLLDVQQVHTHGSMNGEIRFARLSKGAAILRYDQGMSHWYISMGR